MATNAISNPHFLTRLWGSAEGARRKTGVVLAAGVLAASCSSNEAQDQSTTMDGSTDGTSVEASQGPAGTEPTQTPEANENILDTKSWDQVKELVAREVGAGGCDFIAGPELVFDSSSFSDGLVSRSSDYMRYLTTDQNFQEAWEMISESTIDHYGLVEEDWVNRQDDFWSEFDGQEPRLIDAIPLEETELGQEIGIELALREPIVVAHEVWPRSEGDPRVFAHIFTKGDHGDWEFTDTYPDFAGRAPWTNVSSADEYRCYTSDRL